eukprot:CAMPEP_0202864066 /NCGR_PEP_ID=MMETSP1391-20130828/4456_1 /ASSEMBLY_ACC=CAM_ASM_000867 /TAXON_ID=1034604 /ORGANISM="Chlamydomonas leiostraca, Strain SAG 11-49" /LENGTH=499 /DNA_ID=CAMNT_0049543771 /DNA_START=147 /DNA_END=1643 /DNA_ORIENTATION=-
MCMRMPRPVLLHAAEQAGGSASCKAAKEQGSQPPPSSLQQLDDAPTSGPAAHPKPTQAPQGAASAPWHRVSVPEGLRFGLELETVVVGKGDDDRSWLEDHLSAHGAAGWRVVNDDTIEDAHDTERAWLGAEFVSPILQGAEGIAQVHRMAAALKPLPLEVNTTTGLHVHVSTSSGFTTAHLARLAQLFMYLEPALDLIQHESRRGRDECKAACTIVPQTSYLFELWDKLDFLAWRHEPPGVVRTKLAAGEPVSQEDHQQDWSTLRSVHRVVTREWAGPDRDARRHHKLNFAALLKHGTVEFRHPAADTDASVISGYVLLYLKMVEWCEQHSIWDLLCLPDEYEFRCVHAAWQLHRLMTDNQLIRRVSYPGQRAQRSAIAKLIAVQLEQAYGYLRKAVRDQGWVHDRAFRSSDKSVIPYLENMQPTQLRKAMELLQVASMAFWSLNQLTNHDGSESNDTGTMWEVDAARAELQQLAEPSYASTALQQLQGTRAGEQLSAL